MKLILPIFICIHFILPACNNQNKASSNKDALKKIISSPNNFEFTYEAAHPIAQSLMKEDFYWSPIEETAPFGSDDGFDAAYGFVQWRALNRSLSPLFYLHELFVRWNYPAFDLNELDTLKIKAYVSSTENPDEAKIKERISQMKIAMKGDTSFKLNDEQIREGVIAISKEMGETYLVTTDNAIIGTGFAQFVLEGKIDSDLKTVTLIAINRELSPFLINRYHKKYRDFRKEQLLKMLAIVNQMEN